jgi:hypothetical protein
MTQVTKVNSLTEVKKIVARKMMYEAIHKLHQINGNMEKTLLQVQDALMSVKYGIDMTEVEREIKEASLEPNLRITFEDCSELSRQCAEVRRKAGLR